MHVFEMTPWPHAADGIDKQIGIYLSHFLIYFVHFSVPLSHFINPVQAKFCTVI